MTPDAAVDNRSRRLDEYDLMIEKIMDDEEIDQSEAERRYELSREKYLQRYETDGCDA